jgi:hypothetical protein
MDPELSRLFGGEEGAVTLRVSLLIHGSVVTGGPTHPSNWGKDVNAILEEQAATPGYDPLALAFLAQLPAEHDDDSVQGYGTLRNVWVELPNGRDIYLRYMRLDLEHVAAWWLRSPETPDQAQPRNLGA